MLVKPEFSEWEAVIGLELHAQLKTETKQYCRCKAVFTNDPQDANKHVCPICLGYPGVLPVLNKRSVELALRLAQAAKSKINHKSVFARKNYFYPDLPKGFQISQYEVPLAEGGSLCYYFVPDKKSPPQERTANFVRMHLEEDTAKSYHQPNGTSIIDFNRGGIPLIEIVTQPDFRSADEAIAYLEEIRLTMIYLSVSDANMELGQMRCEPNVSVRPKGASELRIKSEIKNLNSFATLKKAVEYEFERQVHIWQTGGRVLPQTLRWDDTAVGFDGRIGSTVAMRTKETADDYRYFDEPDLPPLVITELMLEQASDFGMKTAFSIKKHLMESDGLSEYDARNIVINPDNYYWYSVLVRDLKDSKLVANWVLGDISRWRSELGTEFKATPESTLRLLNSLSTSEITNPQAKDLFVRISKENKDIDALIRELHFATTSLTDNLDSVIEAVIADNPSPVSDYLKGKKAAVMVLVGQVMKRTKGSANAQDIKLMLEKKLDETR
jgi:aspartyl-tRNA(Asn)/glutamyl-tRNA(Gln) amidotransferase subunit B